MLVLHMGPDMTHFLNHIMHYSCPKILQFPNPVLSSAVIQVEVMTTMYFMLGIYLAAAQTMHGREQDSVFSPKFAKLETIKAHALGTDTVRRPDSESMSKGQSN